MTPTFQAAINLMATQGPQRTRSLLKNPESFRLFLTNQFLPATEQEYPHQRDSQEQQDDKMERISRQEKAEQVWRELSPKERETLERTVISMDPEIEPENFRLLDPAPPEMLP